MMPGPFFELAGAALAAIERKRAFAPVCSNCGSADRLRYFAVAEELRYSWGRANCYRCDHEGRTPWSRPRSAPRASLRPLLTWAVVIFLAGVLVGLGVSRATSALSDVSSTVRLSPAVDGASVRAAHSPTSRSRPGSPEADELGVPSAEPARTNYSHADETTPAASETASAPQPSPRDDPPSSTVLGLERDPVRDVLNAIHRAAREFGQDPGRMVGVAYCESTFNRTKVGSAGERGVWQFKTTTWSENAPRLAYGPDDITDVVASSRVAAEMWSRGMQGRWTCWR